jgi:hypothetical protein
MKGLVPAGIAVQPARIAIDEFGIVSPKQPKQIRPRNIRDEAIRPQSATRPGNAHGATMTDFIYNERGDAQAFRLGDHLYDLAGRAIARISAERVYRLSGASVGELYRNMVVDRPVGARRDLAAVEKPKDVGVPSPDTSRGTGGGGFPDVFDRLVAGASQAGTPPPVPG